MKMASVPPKATVILLVVKPVPVITVKVEPLVGPVVTDKLVTVGAPVYK